MVKKKSILEISFLANHRHISGNLFWVKRVISYLSAIPTSMANVMLTSETAKDPNKPFKLRVEDVCTKFDVRICVWSRGSSC